MHRALDLEKEINHIAPKMHHDLIQLPICSRLLPLTAPTFNGRTYDQSKEVNSEVVALLHPLLLRVNRCTLVLSCDETNPNCSQLLNSLPLPASCIKPPRHHI